jgi:hypothetical protein
MLMVWKTVGDLKTDIETDRQARETELPTERNRIRVRVTGCGTERESKRVRDRGESKKHSKGQTD